MESLSFLYDTDSLFFKIIISLFLGLIVGLRKEIINQKSDSSGLFGLRTMPLIVLLGTLSSYFGDAILGISFFFMVTIMALAYYNGAFNLKKYGLTSEITMLIMFLAGILVEKGDILSSIILTVLVAIVHAYKNPFHAFARKITFKEWSGALQLIIISALVLPFLPRKPIDSFGVFNPFEAWILVIAISSISFIGYFLSKFFSQKNSLNVTSFLGSIVSSTAVTISIAQQSKKERDTQKNEGNKKLVKKKSKQKNKNNLFIIALLIGVIVMQLRVIIEIYILGNFGNFFLENSQENSLSTEFVSNNTDFLIMILPSVIMILYFMLHFFLLKKKLPRSIPEKENPQDKNKEISLKKNTTEREKEDSPFEILPALKFGIFFTAMLFIVYFSKEYFGNSGIYISSLIASTVDIEASILSTLKLFTDNSISAQTLSTVIIIALSSNTLIKFFYVYFFGEKKLAYSFLKILLPGVLLGMLSFVCIQIFL